MIPWHVNAKWGQLQRLANKFGDFKLAHAKLVDGNSIWSLRHSVMELWHLDDLFQEVQLYKAHYVPAWWFVEKSNNRSLFEPELCLDLENPDLYSQVLEKLLGQCLVFSSYRTGSRGFHFRLIMSDFPLMTPEKRKNLRRRLTQHFGCDALKVSENVLIALEDAPHWKTGRPKELVFSNEGGGEN
ncbi:hypothetical protein HYU11_03045 [Candidatus Woesearchaeota archaeon]|nr:hypothetical protein [Candidatus Woesearchaeota archaeon]